MAAKHKQVLNNIVDFRMSEVENINSPIKKLDYKILYELIMNMKTILGERVFLAIKKSQQGKYVLQAKHKYKEEVSAFTSYLSAQLVKLYRSEVLTKFNPSI